MMKRDWQWPNSGPPSDSPDLWWVWAIFIIVLAAYASAGCVSRQSAPEPQWEPLIYSIKYDGKTCEVFDAGDEFGDVFRCDEPRVRQFYCAPLDDLVALKKKLQRCEAWR
jgi:hypothetical protein